MLCVKALAQSQEPVSTRKPENCEPAPSLTIIERPSSSLQKCSHFSKDFLLCSRMHSNSRTSRCKIIRNCKL